MSFPLTNTLLCELICEIWKQLALDVSGVVTASVHCSTATVISWRGKVQAHMQMPPDTIVNVG